MTDVPNPPRDDDSRRRALDRISRQQPELPPKAPPHVPHVQPPTEPESPSRVAYARSTPVAVADESPMWTLISAILFLYVGFYVAYAPINNNVTLYNLSLTGFTWMARIVGVGLLVVAGLAFFRVPGVRALDFGMALLAAVGCLATGFIWIFNGDNDGFLIGLFGLVNAMAARSAWFAWKGRLEP